MGGRVGLKGTDDAAIEAKAAGAEPIAGPRAQVFARAVLELSKKDPNLRIQWVTCGGAMGTDSLRGAGVAEEAIDKVYLPKERTTAVDTRAAVKAIVDRGAELLMF